MVEAYLLHDVCGGVVREDTGRGLNCDGSPLAPARSMDDAQCGDDV
jgi:hypothetical protein